MAEPSANPTDSAICRILAAGPLPTAALAARLNAPERTVRYRLARLRQAGSVGTGPDGLHRLADVASPVSAGSSAAGGPDHQVDDVLEPGHDGHLTLQLLLAVAGLGLAIAAGLAAVILKRRSGLPAAPAPAWGPYGTAGWEAPGPW